jgi:hypothetical protein
MSYEEVFGDLMQMDLPAPAAVCPSDKLTGVDGERYYTDVFSTCVL